MQPRRLSGRCGRRFASAVALALVVSCAQAAAPRRVLIIQSFGREFAPFNTVSSTFRTELARQSPEPIEFYEASLETARFAEADRDVPVADYLRALFAEHQLDVIVTIGGPATQFVVRQRPTFFPGTPALACVEQRATGGVLATNMAVVPAQLTLPVVIENILELMPATTNVMVIIGTSPFERFWMAAMLRDFVAFTNRTGFIYLNDLPLEEMRERVAAPPPSSAILYAALWVDAAGVPYEQEKALTSLRAVANAPMFGLFEHDLGEGIVGGKLLSMEALGRAAAGTALRLLAGERPEAIRTPLTGPETPVYDWRELERWGISEARLPPGSEVRFRVPTLWERYKWLLIAIIAVCVAEAVLIVGLVRNRRRLHQAQTEVVESERRLKLAAGAAELGLWSWDIKQDEIWVTDKARELFGFAPSERLHFQRFLSSVHPDDREPVSHAVAKSMNGEGDYESEYRIAQPDGRTLWIAARGQVEFNRDGKPLRMRGVSIDITARKQAEDKFRLAVEASPSGIVLVNPEGRIILVNTQTEKLFGYTREELIRQEVEVLVPERFRNAHPRHRATFMAAPSARAMGAGRELFARRKDGSEFPVEIGLSPIQAQEGTLILTVIVDITARKASEAELQRQRAELSHVTRVSAMGQLAAALAHELNQPLGAILRNAEAAELYLQQNPPDHEEIRAILADIRQDDQRAGAVIDRMRSLLRRRNPAFEPIDLNELLEQIATLMRAETQTRKVGLEIKIFPGLPPVLGDRVHLQQVLLNLILNGMDAMNGTPLDRRGIVISVSSLDTQMVEIAVRDCGQGIPADQLTRVFEPFFTTKSNGMGMGLSISRTIIEAHGGRIWAENNPDGGTSVRFTLRAADKQSS